MIFKINVLGACSFVHVPLDVEEGSAVAGWIRFSRKIETPFCYRDRNVRQIFN